MALPARRIGDAFRLLHHVRCASERSNPMKQIIQLPAELLAAWDEARSLSSADVCTRLRGRRGNLNVATLRRWASPRRGCRPQGETGPVLLFPVVRLGGELRTM